MRSIDSRTPCVNRMIQVPFICKEFREGSTRASTGFRAADLLLDLPAKFVGMSDPVECLERAAPFRG
jgi:hypothetical protein